ncbi:uncharacterized protein LOC116294309 [Actinia tenebrosa]|uniref:Uncharacterized protein LOC116294309 n=1 Tax=Actinia tenebrosa TaxID=6105 RepID=A0A6P8HN10_ACTTE|nr:uncharacterized protein LOC116294309 [Actinia tenebrosa]XP_031557750.1 uncharacterized protein LOC116294309 [Actinia tenebrosa]XP_031557751.1 uncharacterized protein LOC116294309 [Actinia tenebrosa]XP_031557752.1 uncharacterized protein LOC116294309 [Actinia tenebrosa]XP_031557753.1 uncharacterized protein LOC116294309 [Actinia tenebrosa]XP_031557754.1 uncharacterized protein LOC116294309 [Actinia tenebrosa]XP_031557755.1 uncharacterized protein LOC116294309 [Actinia tenebrosa]
MALASGLQYIDNLALRFSLHGLEDSFAGKPTFCFSWSEPFDLDTVAGKLASNPKRSRSFPTTFAKGTHGNIDKREHIRPKSKPPFRSLNDGDTKNTVQSDKQFNDKSSDAYASKSEGCKGIEEESSDEELCDLMAEQENIQFTQEHTSVKRCEKDASELEICERKKESRKRFLEEIDTYSSRNAKRPRPRLDFHKVLQSRTRQIEDNSTQRNIGTYFSPITDSDPED